MVRILTNLFFFAGMVALLFASTQSISAQVNRLTLKDIPGGFIGTFESEGVTLTINSTQAADNSISTRITDSERRLLAAAVYGADIVTVTLSDVAIVFPISKTSTAGGGAKALSKADGERYEAFRLSNESRPLREMIVEIIRQRSGAKLPLLKGVLLISVVLGDGPGFPQKVSLTGSNGAKCSSPKSFRSSHHSRHPNQYRPPLRPSVFRSLPI